MNFNYKIVTGDPSISGSIVDNPHKNRRSFLDRTHITAWVTDFRFYDEDGNFKDEPFVLNQNVISEAHTSLLSYNSQTLLEETPTIEEGVHIKVHSLNTGDYFTKHDYGFSLCHLAIDNLKESDVVFYNKREAVTGVALLKTAGNSFSVALAELATKNHGIYGDSFSVQDLFENYDVFFNGQKLLESNYPAASATGKLFAIKADDDSFEISSTEPDIYGASGFIDGQVELYFNGMEQDAADFMQLYTGVYMVEEGVGASFVISNPTVETYSI